MKLMIAGFLLVAGAFGQVVITDTGSTNRPGMTVTIGARGPAAIGSAQGTQAKMTLKAELRKRLVQDVNDAGPLDRLNARHCMKSVSFGSSLYVSFRGLKSPDLSCAGQTDPAVIALQKDVEEIMGQARGKVPQGRFR